MQRSGKTKHMYFILWSTSPYITTLASAQPHLHILVCSWGSRWRKNNNWSHRVFLRKLNKSKIFRKHVLSMPKVDILMPKVDIIYQQWLLRATGHKKTRGNQQFKFSYIIFAYTRYFQAFVRRINRSIFKWERLCVRQRTKLSVRLSKEQPLTIS